MKNSSRSLRFLLIGGGAALLLVSFGGCSNPPTESPALGLTDPSLDDAPSSDTPAALVPELHVSQPARGLITTEMSGTVIASISNTDPGLDYAAMVEAVVVELDETHAFAQPVGWTSGTNIIQTVAADSLGAMAVDHRAVLAGNFSPPESALEDAIIFQLTAAAMADMAGRANDYFEASDLEQFIQNPVLDEDQQFCMGMCWTMWGIEMNAHNPRFADIEAYVTPWDGGVDVLFVMHDFAMDWTGTGVLSEVGYTGSGSIRASAILMAMSVALDWREDALDASVLGIAVDASGFTFDFDNFMYEAMSFFGMDLDMFVVGMIENTFANMMVERVPVVAREMIEEMNFSKGVPAAGQSYLFEGSISDLAATQEGIWVAYDTTFAPPVRLHPTAPGYLTRSVSLPAPSPSTQEVVGAMGLNLVNQVFYGLWDGGALDMEMPGEAIGIEAAAIAQLMPGVTEIDVRTVAMLPPTVRASETGDGVATLSLGDLIFSLFEPNMSTEYPLMTVALSMTGALNFVSSASGSGLVPVISAVQVYPSVVLPESGLTTQMMTGLESMLVPLAEQVLPQLMGSMMEFPLDLLEGYTFTEVTVDPANGNGSYFKMMGTLVSD